MLKCSTFNMGLWGRWALLYAIIICGPKFLPACFLTLGSTEEFCGWNSACVWIWMLPYVGFPRSWVWYEDSRMGNLWSKCSQTRGGGREAEWNIEDIEEAKQQRVLEFCFSLILWWGFGAWVVPQNLVPFGARRGWLGSVVIGYRLPGLGRGMDLWNKVASIGCSSLRQQWAISSHLAAKGGS